MASLLAPPYSSTNPLNPLLDNPSYPADNPPLPPSRLFGPSYPGDNPPAPRFYYLADNSPSPQYSPPAPAPAPAFPSPSPQYSPPAPAPFPSWNIDWPPSLVIIPQTNPSMSTGAMAGLIMGILRAIIVLIALGILVFRYSRKKRDEAESIGGGEPKDGPSTGFARQQSIPSPAEHEMTVLSVPVSPDIGPYSKESPFASDNAGSEKPVSSAPVRRSLGLPQSTFTYEELSKATDNFSEVNLLGQGGFGYVYKGVLSNGEVVAVKRLKNGSGQGKREFQAEIETISRVHHRHLVSLAGYCVTGDQRLLVYEFLPNNTLAFHLHGKQRPVMKWATRMKVARGTAKGLAYLHEDCQPKIIHRDIKAANILLDHSFEAKVADFGLAKYFSDTDTHVSTRVMGTFGYMAPEYASSGKLTEKSDVFSFGVVLLELVTGRLPVDRTPSSHYDCIVDWARPLLQQALQLGNYDALVDPKLQKDYDCSEITRVIACAAACVNHSARHRPQMNTIVQALVGNMSLEDLNNGTAPGYVRSHISCESSDYNSGQYKEDLVKFRKLALESQEQGSSEYNASTGDYAMNPWSSSTEGRRTTEEMRKMSVSKEGLETMQEGRKM